MAAPLERQNPSFRAVLSRNLGIDFLGRVALDVRDDIRDKLNTTDNPVSPHNPCRAEECLQRCIPSAQDHEPGSATLSMYKEWAIFVNEHERKRFIDSVMLVLSDNDIAKIADRRVGLFFPRSEADITKFIVSVVAQDLQGGAETSFTSRNAAETRKLAFQFFRLEIEQRLGIILRGIEYERRDSYGSSSQLVDFATNAGEPRMLGTRTPASIPAQPQAAVDLTPLLQQHLWHNGLQYPWSNTETPVTSSRRRSSSSQSLPLSSTTKESAGQQRMRANLPNQSRKLSVSTTWADVVADQSNTFTPSQLSQQLEMMRIAGEIASPTTIASSSSLRRVQFTSSGATPSPAGTTPATSISNQTSESSLLSPQSLSQPSEQSTTPIATAAKPRPARYRSVSVTERPQPTPLLVPQSRLVPLTPIYSFPAAPLPLRHSRSTYELLRPEQLSHQARARSASYAYAAPINIGPNNLAACPSPSGYRHQFHPQAAAGDHAFADPRRLRRNGSSASMRAWWCD